MEGAAEVEGEAEGEAAEEWLEEWLKADADRPEKQGQAQGLAQAAPGVARAREAVARAAEAQKEAPTVAEVKEVVGLKVAVAKVEVAGLAHWQALAADDSTRSEVAAEAAEAATEAGAGACAALPHGSPGALRKRAASVPQGATPQSASAARPRRSRLPAAVLVAVLGAVLAGCLRGAACSLNGALHHDVVRARARVP